MNKIVILLVLSLVLSMGLYAVDNSEQLLKELGIEMVKISGKNFEISSTEITQKAYVAITNDAGGFLRKGDNLPANNIHFEDAARFCNKLSEKIGLPSMYEVYTGMVYMTGAKGGFRLPMSDEIRYVAGSGTLDEIAWYRKNSEGITHPVASKKANNYGLYDIFGNVWELHVETIYSTGDVIFNVFGGSFDSEALKCRTSYENYGSEDINHPYNIGFRIVRDIE